MFETLKSLLAMSWSTIRKSQQKVIVTDVDVKLIKSNFS